MKVLGYLAFTGVIVAVIQTLKLPSIILSGYLLVAVVGFVLLLRDLARRAAVEGLVSESTGRIVAEAERGDREAEVARRSAWSADNVVDLDAVRRGAAIDGHLAIGFSFLPNARPLLRSSGRGGCLCHGQANR